MAAKDVKVLLEALDLKPVQASAGSIDAVELEDGRVVFVINPSGTALSGSGKNITVASTGGFQYPQFSKIQGISINATRKP